MSTDEYVPSDGDLYAQIAKRRYEYDYTSPWEHLAPAPRKILTQAARNTMEPLIALVRRDAAREALDGFKAWRGTPQCPAISPPDPCHRPEGHAEPHAHDIPEGECDWREVDWSDTDAYRDQYYPEETHGR